MMMMMMRLILKMLILMMMMISVVVCNFELLVKLQRAAAANQLLALQSVFIEEVPSETSTHPTQSYLLGDYLETIW